MTLSWVTRIEVSCDVRKASGCHGSIEHRGPMGRGAARAAMAHAKANGWKLRGKHTCPRCLLLVQLPPQAHR